MSFCTKKRGIKGVAKGEDSRGVFMGGEKLVYPYLEGWQQRSQVSQLFLKSFLLFFVLARNDFFLKKKSHFQAVFLSKRETPAAEREQKRSRER